MPQCPTCHEYVQDVPRHQQRSKRCRYTAIVQQIQSDGWCMVLGAIPREAPRGFREAALWPDRRLATGPYAVRGGGMGPVWLQYGVLAQGKDGFDRKLSHALDAYVAERVLEDGGRIPFSYRTLRGYGDVEQFRAETLWEWVTRGELDDKIRRYQDAQGSKWYDLPDYVKDPRIPCPDCAHRVHPAGMRQHQRTMGCMLARLRRQERVVVAYFAGRDLQSHPFWDVLRHLGIPVGLEMLYQSERLFVCVTVPRKDLARLKVVRHLLQECEALQTLLYESRLDRKQWIRAFASDSLYGTRYAGLRRDFFRGLFDSLAVTKPVLDVALPVVQPLAQDLGPDLVEVAAALEG